MTYLRNQWRLRLRTAVGMVERAILGAAMSAALFLAERQLRRGRRRRTRSAADALADEQPGP